METPTTGLFAAHPTLDPTYRRLADVGLNPRRHTAPSALAHSEAVAARAAALGRANQLPGEDVALLEDLGRVHDLGKVTGTARPERSLAVLREHGVTDPRLLALVKWHDVNLPWYLADRRGEPPTDRAWRRLAAELDVGMLALFMVADRVDAPPGWRRNAPLTWFLAEARRRGHVGELVLEVPGAPSEVSAGAALVRGDGDARELLVIRARAAGYELAKGGIEWDELPEEAAARELAEEAGVESAVRIGPSLGHLDYSVGDGPDRHVKRVRYFGARTAEEVRLGPLPARTRERRWLRAGDLADLPLVSEELRAILGRALAG